MRESDVADIVAEMEDAWGPGEPGHKRVVARWLLSQDFEMAARAVVRLQETTKFWPRVAELAEQIRALGPYDFGVHGMGQMARPALLDGRERLSDAAMKERAVVQKLMPGVVLPWQEWAEPEDSDYQLGIRPRGRPYGAPEGEDRMGTPKENLAESIRRLGRLAVGLRRGLRGSDLLTFTEHPQDCDGMSSKEITALPWLGER